MSNCRVSGVEVDTTGGSRWLVASVLGFVALGKMSFSHHKSYLRWSDEVLGQRQEV